MGAYRIGIDTETSVTTTTVIQNSGQPIITTSTSTVDGSDDGIRFDVLAMVGVELPFDLFSELSALVITKLDEVNANPVNLAVGLRF